MSFGTRRNRIAFGLHLAATVIIFQTTIHQAFAEDLQVFANQYVVEYPRTSAALSASQVTSPEAPVQNVQSLGGNSTSALITVGPKTAAFGTSAGQSGDAIVAYDHSQDACIHLLKTGAVTSCSPNYVLKASDVTPNDPQFGSLWGLNASKGINAPQGWDVSTGSSSVVVAVIDTGVDYTHPDLAANMWRNSAEIEGNNVDDDHNGYVDDVFGISSVGRSGNPLDDNGHGSHCAGTIGGVGNNGVGVTGINWNVKIMALKFLSASGSGSLASAIEAINYMVDMKNKGVNVRVSSNSWGGGGYSASLATAIKRATDAGIMFVAAAGNESNNNDQNASYPAGYDGVVSVAAIDQNRNLASFSNYGASSVDIAAPGVGIVSTYSAGRYATLSGTSMATPHVSGALALLVGAIPSISAADAINRLYDSGVPLSTLDGVVRTGRMLHLGRLMHNETSPVPQPTPTPPPCSYSTATTSFSSNGAAESAPIVVQGDEFNFKQIDLPFSFPFAGAQRSSLTISPNGVAYVERIPTSMDYQNGPKAPISAIAAFQADLTMDGSNLGARALVESDKVTIYWLAEHYFMRGKGQVGVRLVIHQSGLIEDFITFSTPEIEDYLQQRATVGVTGPSESFGATYAYNSGSIRNGLAVQFSPSCGGNDGGSDNALSLTSLKVRDPRDGERELTPGKAFQLVFNAGGTGTSLSVPLTVSLDNKACQITPTVSINKGRTMVKSRLPSITRVYRRVTISSGSVKGTARIESNNRRTTKRKEKRARSANFEGACEAIANAIR